MLFSSPRRATGAMLRQLAEGLTYAARTPGVMLIVILMSTIGTFGYNFTVVLPLLARNALGVGADGFGALSSAMGLGSLMASLAMASFLGASRRVLIAGAAAFSLFEGGLALSGSYHVSLGLMVAIGVAGLLFTATANALLQLSVPDVLRGRVLSLYTLLFLGTTPIGGMVTGALADRFGIQVTIGIEAAISALGLIAGLVYVLAQQKRAATRSSYRLTDDLSDSNK